MTSAWEDNARMGLDELLSDPVLKRLLERSSLTRPQFESFLLDQIGAEMAERRLSRSEMALLRREHGGISRGAFNRTLRQGRTNVSESVHTLLLLGYCGLLETPVLAPFVETSDRLRSQIDDLKKATSSNTELFERTVKNILDNLEEAYEALMGKEV